MNLQADVLIVGAGLAGLCCARRLHEAGIPFMLFEGSDSVGGRVKTDVVNGFLLDRGFQIFLTAYPEARSVLDYQSLDFQPFLPGALVRCAGKFHAISDPFRRPAKALETMLSPIGSVSDKMRMGLLQLGVLSRVPSSRESAITVFGRVAENPMVRLGGLEIQPSAIRVDGPAAAPLPLDPQSKVESNSDVRLDWRFLDLRKPENLLTFQVQTTCEWAMRQFWDREGFIEIHTPKLMGSPSETRAELFELEYFGRKAYLAQSPQFYKQMAIAAGLDKVFEIGPAFRADPSFTPRHSTEFISIDVEVAWIESHLDVIALEERWLQAVLQAVKDKHGVKIKESFGVDVTVPTAPFPRITMAEAVEILKQRGHSLPPEKKGDLDPAGERLLGEYVKKELGHEFVFLVDWPSSARAFYHMRYEKDPTITKSFDLLWNGIEITTGAQREHRYDFLVQQAIDKGLAVEGLKFYLDFFKYGCPPHGGFGFGLARMLAIMLNRGNIRDVTLLFRGPTRLEP